MSQKFKAKKRKKPIMFKLILFILIALFSFNLTYKFIYKSYISKLDNEKIINHIISNTKNNKTSNKILSKYQNPNYILSNNFKNKTNKETLLVENDLNNKVQVYIYSTHETESYSDKYLEVYNIKPTVKTMNYILSDYLNDYGINTIIEEESITDILKKNNWSYKFSYDASRILIEKAIQSNDSLKLIIDLHRDSASKEKTTLTINETNYAKILFVIGLDHENYQSNLALVEKLNDMLEQEIPGISRGITKKSGTGVNGIYNQNLSKKSILIELGGQYNEIEELNNTLKILAKVILKYIEGEQ